MILLPTSEINSTAFSFHVPPVSIAIDANWWVFASSWYFAVLFSAARFAAADAVVAVSVMYELEYVSETVTSHATGSLLSMG